jgi:hypothetical protein
MKAKSKVGMGFKKAAASIAKKDTVNLTKALTSPKAKAMQDSTLKANIKKTGTMPMGLKVKKETTFKPTKDMVMISKSKNPILTKKIVGVTPKKAK